jgi:FtsZ-binding cell division protein ZapB
MMAIIRQSVISLVYVLILIPRIKDCAEVLDQRVINFYRRQGELEREIEALKAELAGVGRPAGRLSASRKKELEQELHEVQTELEELNSSREQLTNEQRMEEKAKVRRNS